MSISSCALIFGQEEITQSERQNRINLKINGEDYLQLENLWLSENKIFPALVVQNTNAEVQYIFKTYKTIKPSSIDRIIDRLKSEYPSIQTLEIDNHDIVVTFAIQASEEEKNGLFKIFGYNSYEIF